MLKVRVYDSASKEKFMKQSKDFALVQLQPKAKNEFKNPVHLILTIDASGSMNDLANYKSGKSKLDYVKATVSSIVEYLQTLPEYDILLSILTFNSEVTLISEYLKVSELNEDDITEILSKIKAHSCTNIEKALRLGTETVTKFPQFFNSQKSFFSFLPFFGQSGLAKYGTPKAFKTLNILLTDGEINQGESRPESLVQIFSEEKMSLSLLGYGDSHDPILLNRLAQLSKGDYTFVDSFENAEAVYGEVLSSVLDPAWEDVTIQIENGTIFDYEKNEWTDSLFIPQIGDGEEKSFTCRLTEDSAIEVKYRDVTGAQGILTTDELRLISTSEEFVYEDSASLKLYWLRYLTMEMMNLVLPKSSRQIEGFSEKTTQRKLETKCRQIEEFLNLFEKKYDVQLSVEECQLLKSLRDDLYIAKKCIGIAQRSSILFLGARMRSQGAQRAYNISNFDTLIKGDDGYKINKSKFTAYASVNKRKTMCSISKTKI